MKGTKYAKTFERFIAVFVKLAEHLRFFSGRQYLRPLNDLPPFQGGFSDLNFPTEFEVFRHSQENEQGLLVLSDLDLSVLGQKKKVSRGKRIVSLKISEKTKSKDPKKESETSPTLELEILSKDFSEDYRKMEMGGRKLEPQKVIWWCGSF